MTKYRLRSRLFGGVCMFVPVAIGLSCWSGAASAESTCSIDSTSPQIEFSCGDPAVSESTSGVLSAGSVLSSDYALINVYNNLLPAELSLDGGTLTAIARPVVTLRSIGGTVDYVSTATTQTTEGFNTVLVADSISAQLGTTIVDGGRGYGLYSLAENGNNQISAVSTTVTAPLSIGLVGYATNGSIALNTGNVTAAADGSWGVYAQTTAAGSCGSNTVNVTGHIISSNWGVRAESCGLGVVNVEASAQMTRTEGWGAATIRNNAGSSAITNIDGVVSALTPADLAIQTGGLSSTTTISSTGILSGTALMSDADDSVDIRAGGIWRSAGESWFEGGADVVNNAGTIRVDAGSARFESLELLQNSGAIDLTGGAIGDSLFVAGDYVGANGSLLVNVGDAGADQLIIGGTASGQTTVFVNYEASSSVNLAGIRLVDSAAASTGAFKLGGVTGNTSGLVGYHIVQRGNELLLVAAPASTSLQPLLVAPVASGIWFQSADQVDEYAEMRRSDLNAGRTNPVGFWGNLYVAKDREGHVTTQQVFGFDLDMDGRLETDRKGAQAGVDFLLGSNFVLGLTGGYEEADADGRGSNGGVRASGYNLGAYAQLSTTSGFYAGLLAKSDWTNAHLTDSLFSSADGHPDATILGVKGEIGYMVSINRAHVDLGADLSYIRSRIDGFTADGIDFDFERNRVVRGDLRARAEFGSETGFFVEAKLNHEFDANSKLTLISGADADSADIGGRGTWGRLEAGLGSRLKSGPRISAWVDVGDVRGLGTSIGIRF